MLCVWQALESKPWFERLVAVPRNPHDPGHPTVYGAACTQLAHIAAWQGDHTKATALFAEVSVVCLLLHCESATWRLLWTVFGSLTGTGTLCWLCRGAHRCRSYLG